MQCSTETSNEDDTDVKLVKPIKLISAEFLLGERTLKLHTNLAHLHFIMRNNFIILEFHINLMCAHPN